MTPIDYDRNAATYRQARALGEGILRSWQDAVTAAVPEHLRRGRVLDLGSGAGQFSEPLVRWLDAEVVAVEPSDGMRGQARASGLPRRAAIVGGRAEALALRDGCIDVAWLSTVVHQFTDRDRAAAELRRVVQPGGQVLVRGFFRELGRIGLFGHFPGIERAVDTFPRTDEIVAVFATHGFALTVSELVEERHEFDLRSWVARARRLRTIDSMLRPLTDEEFDAGIAAIDAAAADEVGPVTVRAPLRFLCFGARHRTGRRA